MIYTIKKLVKLVIVQLMVRVSTLVHVWQVSVGKLTTVSKVAIVTYCTMALRAEQNAVTKIIRASVTHGIPVMRLPTPSCAGNSVAFNEFFAASSTLPPLSVPSLSYSVVRKRHHNTSRRIINGWENNGDDMRVLIRDGKSTNIAIMISPPAYSLAKRKPTRTEYHIVHADKFVGLALTLATAKRKAEAYLRKKKK